MKELDELLQEENVSLDIDKTINKRMNRMLSSKVIKILLCLVLAVAAVTSGVLFIYDIACYNPGNEEEFLIEDKNNDYDEFKVLLQTYIHMNFPGQVCITPNENDGEKKGVGKYSFQVRIEPSAYFYRLGGDYNTVFEISNSKLTVKDNGMEHPGLTRIAYDFITPDPEIPHYDNNVHDVYDDIKQLPDSAYILASVSFENYLTLKDTIELMNNYDDVFFCWLALQGMDDYNVIDLPGGMTLYDATLESFTEEADKKYPNFYITSNELSEDILKENYISKLQLLIDHPKFFEVMSSYFKFGLTIDDLKKRQEIAKDGMNVYGVKVNIQKKDLLKMIEEKDLSYIYIHDIKLSRYSK